MSLVESALVPFKALIAWNRRGWARNHVQVGDTRIRAEEGGTILFYPFGNINFLIRRAYRLPDMATAEGIFAIYSRWERRTKIVALIALAIMAVLPPLFAEWNIEVDAWMKTHGLMFLLLYLAAFIAVFAIWGLVPGMVANRACTRYPRAPGATLSEIIASRENFMGSNWRLGFLIGNLVVMIVVGGAAFYLVFDRSRTGGVVILGLTAALVFYVGILLTTARHRRLKSENQRLEKLVESRTEELRELNRHKSEFLANMSHELRTPLNAIIGFSEVMISGMAGPQSDKQREFCADIRDSGKHLLSLINDILDLSKVEAGRMELDVTRFDVPQALANACALVRGRAEGHAIQLETLIAENVGEFEGDERKFKQIVLNLLTNAIKFTPEGGSVALAAQRSDGAYVFSVKDTGIGIAAEDQERVFEEFRQVGVDSARKAEGTGLGLSLTKRLVELHGGRISIESAPGHGSTFTFNLPISEPVKLATP